MKRKVLFGNEIAIAEDHTVYQLGKMSLPKSKRDKEYNKVVKNHRSSTLYELHIVVMVEPGIGKTPEPHGYIDRQSTLSLAESKEITKPKTQDIIINTFSSLLIFDKYIKEKGYITQLLNNPRISNPIILKQYITYGNKIGILKHGQLPSEVRFQKRRTSKSKRPFKGRKSLKQKELGLKKVS